MTLIGKGHLGGSYLAPVRKRPFECSNLGTTWKEYEDSCWLQGHEGIPQFIRVSLAGQLHNHRHKLLIRIQVFEFEIQIGGTVYKSLLHGRETQRECLIRL